MSLAYLYTISLWMHYLFHQFLLTRIHYKSNIFLANSFNLCFFESPWIFFSQFHFFSRTQYLDHKILINSLRFSKIQHVRILFIAIFFWIHKLFLLFIRWIHYWCIYYFSKSLLNYSSFRKFTLNPLPFYWYHYGSIFFRDLSVTRFHHWSMFFLT